MDIDRSNAEPSGKQEILRISSFADLPGPSQDALLDLGRVEQIPRRHRLAEQGEPPRSLFLIGAGRVKLERVTGSHIFPLGHRGPGQLVGETAVAGTHGATETATVLDDTEGLTFPIAGFRKLLAADAAVRAAMAAAIVHVHQATEARLIALLRYGVEARLARFLLDAGTRWGTPHEGGELISAPFTHADMALLIGSTRETVTLLLGKLKRDGLISFDRRRVVMRDRTALSQHAASL